MKCPGCGYVRKDNEYAPEWQCPSCGIAYNKHPDYKGEDLHLPEEQSGEYHLTKKRRPYAEYLKLLMVVLIVLLPLSYIVKIYFLPIHEYNWLRDIFYHVTLSNDEYKKYRSIIDRYEEWKIRQQSRKSKVRVMRYIPPKKYQNKISTLENDLLAMNKIDLSNLLARLSDVIELSDSCKSVCDVTNNDPWQEFWTLI